MPTEYWKQKQTNKMASQTDIVNNKTQWKTFHIQQSAWKVTWWHLEGGTINANKRLLKPKEKKLITVTSLSHIIWYNTMQAHKFSEAERCICSM